MSNIIEAEVFVTHVFEPKGKYFRFSCKELVSETNKYGNISGPVALYKKIKKNNTYQIAYHKTEDGYLNLDTLITNIASPANDTFPVPKPDGINWPGVMGVVNSMIRTITDSQQLQFWLNIDPKHLSALTIKSILAQKITDQKVKEGLASPNPADVMSGKRKQKADDIDDEIPDQDE